MERLAAEDRLMLWPDERWPQDIGVLAILDGARLLNPDGRPDTLNREVELRGLEPLTPCLQTTGSGSTHVHPRRSPSQDVQLGPLRSRPVAVLPCCAHYLGPGPSRGPAAGPSKPPSIPGRALSGSMSGE